MDSGWVFGIDGGGTSTRLRVESMSGDLLFFGEGGSSNLRAKARAEVLENLSALFRAALGAFGTSGAAFGAAALRGGAGGCAAGFAGSAGVDRPEDRAAFADLVRTALETAAGEAAPLVPIAASNDAEPALVGAIGDTEGFLLIAGTGSIAWARARDGHEARAGGWGHFLGDEGSAFWIAFEALKRGIRSHEGRDLPTSLLETALSFFALRAPEDLIPFVYGGMDKTVIARFAPSVATARDSGDRLARAIFDEAAAGLADLVVSVDRKVGSHIVDRRLAFRGGLIEGDEGLRSAVAALLASKLKPLSIVTAKADAASGACALARALIRPGPDPQRRAR